MKFTGKRFATIIFLFALFGSVMAGIGFYTGVKLEKKRLKYCDERPFCTSRGSSTPIMTKVDGKDWVIHIPHDEVLKDLNEKRADALRRVKVMDELIGVVNADRKKENESQRP